MKKNKIIKYLIVIFTIYFVMVVDASGFKTTIEIDNPYNNQSAMGILNYQGWVMSEDSEAKVNIYVDNELQETVERYEREDVLKAISGYGGRSTNKTPGYRGSIDISNLKVGSHKFKVEVLSSNNEILSTRQTTFNIKDYVGKIEVDKVESDKTKLNIQGWVMSDDQKSSVEVYIDNILQEKVERYGREDVLKVISGYGGRNTNQLPGYRKSYDISNLKDGNHSLRIVIKSSSGKEIQSTTRKFNIKKYSAMIEIDNPINNLLNKQNLSFQGWVMSDDPNAQINIYIDDDKIESSLIKRYEREDVLKVISGYGGRTKNKTPGYKGTINYSKIKEGNHKFRVIVISSNNEIIATKSSNFTLNKYDTKIEIDTPLSNQTKNTTIDIQGWIMTEDTTGTLELYIDGNKINSSLVERYEREDVLKAISGYGGRSTNKTPGYRGSIDSSKMSDGMHTFEVIFISSESPDVVKTAKTSFLIKKYDGILCIDSPTSSNFNSSLKIVGWELSELENSYIKVFVDNTNMNAKITRVDRRDVLDYYKQKYGGETKNPQPGFETILDLSSIKEGSHTLKIYLYTSLNELIGTYSKTIFVYKNKFFGVDVSSYNIIDSWSSIKNNGFDYAIIRSAVRGYGINGLGIDGYLREDDSFYSNVSGARKAGLKVGTYVFSQAVTTIEAIEEANKALIMVNKAGGKSVFDMPIIFDSEFSGCSGRCGRADSLSKADRTTIAIAFLETVKNAGYTPMIYASSSFLNNQLDMSRLSNYEVWVAHYDTDKPSYNGPYQMWQYTSKGTISGIRGNVDLNEIYKKY